MGIVDEGEGQHIPTKEEQEAQINKQQNELQEQQELHRKMRSSKTAEYARDKEKNEEQEGQQQESQQQEPSATAQEQPQAESQR